MSDPTDTDTLGDRPGDLGASLDDAPAGRVALLCPACPFVGYSEFNMLSHTFAHLSDRAGSTPGAASGPRATQRPPAFKRPSIEVGCTPSQWAQFMESFDRYRRGANVLPAALGAEFVECLGEKLQTAVCRGGNSGLLAKPFDDIVAACKHAAVTPVHVIVLRGKLRQMYQEQGEQFRDFAQRVEDAAVDCDFVVPCKHCKRDTDYDEPYIADILITGIYDGYIRRLAQSKTDLRKQSIATIVAFVEGEEACETSSASTGPPKAPPAEAAAMSTFKRAARGSPAPVAGSAAAAKSAKPAGVRPKEMRCACGQKYMDFAPQANGVWNRTPHKSCKKCYLAAKAKRRQQKHASAVTDGDAEPIDVPDSLQFCSAEFGAARRPGRRAGHPRLDVRISMPTSVGDVDIDVTGAVADSGSQVCLIPESALEAFPDPIECCDPSSVPVRMATSAAMSIVKVFQGRISATTGTGDRLSHEGRVYVARGISECYLSCDAMRSLRIIDEHFPTAGAAKASDCGLCVAASSTDASDCACRERTLPPEAPAALPFAPTDDNIAKMKDWLLDRFATSTFNQCTHQPLPAMSGPPMEIHLVDNAVPRNVSTPASVPLHWQEQVKADLDRDCRLGVIEPVTEPSDWCHRMVVVRKHDGKPRRTVDLQPLNKFCRREEYVTSTPSKQARSVPPHAYKTVTDAWNGYHSVPIRQSDRHLTTFVTPWGRFRYCRNPQGFVGAGDGYNRRFDAVLADFADKERCVDDTIFWDTSLERHFWRAIEFLTRCGNAGIVLNPAKFQFAQSTADFAGFRITPSSVLPLPKYLDAIRNFPSPSSITDVRSWFGLVNQVSAYAQTRAFMLPFRELLSPKTPFRWTDKLEEAFQESKLEITRAIREGVRIFDPRLTTCLRTDWSKDGMGYHLLQKTCDCEGASPACCDRWRTTLAGSRFNNGAESRYAPIEGEALAVAWALEQSKYFTQGCHDLVVATDHKPLVALLGDKPLESVTNPRLFRIKQRTGMWKFRIIHLPGKSNSFADAASRHPSELCAAPPVDDDERGLVVAATTALTVTAADIASAGAADPEYSAMLDALRSGKSADPAACGPYWAHRDRMFERDGLILYDDRVVVPPAMRGRVLSVLHSAHQGVSSMMHRAVSCVFWPGLNQDVAATRWSCDTCNLHQPSQPQVPTPQSEPSSTPFEHVVADFFDLHGHHYLVAADRMSGWIDVFESPPGSSAAGARGLIACLRRLFSSKGVPIELASDGGPEFTALDTRNFLQSWGVRQRLSSAYYPQSNGRAESAVKTAKRLLRGHTGPSGSLDTDAFIRALLQHRNTPDASGMSPAYILFGRQLPDGLRFTNVLDKFNDARVHPVWRDTWRLREAANRHRFYRQCRITNARARPQAPLSQGARVLVQNRHDKTWSKSGRVVEILPHGAYRVMVDGSRRVSQRTRQHLKPFIDPFFPYAGQSRDAPPPSLPEVTGKRIEGLERFQHNGSGRFCRRRDNSQPRVPEPSTPPRRTPVTEPGSASSPQRTEPFVAPTPPPSPVIQRLDGARLPQPQPQLQQPRQLQLQPRADIPRSAPSSPSTPEQRPQRRPSTTESPLPSQASGSGRPPPDPSTDCLFVRRETSPAPTPQRPSEKRGRGRPRRLDRGAMPEVPPSAAPPAATPLPRVSLRRVDEGVDQRGVAVGRHPASTSPQRHERATRSGRVSRPPSRLGADPSWPRLGGVGEDYD